MHVKNPCNGLARMGRGLGRLAVVAFLLLGVGCSVFGKSAKEQTLRKQVEADSFPSAKQIGLQSQ